MDSRSLLVADLDGTLLGDDAALARFAAWHDAAAGDHWLAYATGRSRASIARLAAQTALPEPDIVISMVGTEIHDRDGRPWAGWQERFLGWDASAVRDVLAGDARLERQPPATQTALKASYFATGLGPGDVATICRRLADAGIDATVVHSGDRFLDVMPAGAGKGAAASMVARELRVPPDGVLAFGDSGNDLSLFREGFRGTVVANALPELTAAVGPDAYRSPFRHADGVLDGIRYWSGVAPRARALVASRSGAVSASCQRK